MFILGLLLSFISIFFVFFLSLLTHIFRKAHKYHSKKFLSAHPFSFFYIKIHEIFFGQKHFTAMYATCIYTKNIARFAYGFASMLFLNSLYQEKYHWTPLAAILLGQLVLFIFLSDLLPRLMGTAKSEKLFLVGAPFVSLYLLACLPVIYVFLKFSQFVQESITSSSEHIVNVKEKVFDLIQEVLPRNHNLEPSDKKLIESIINFRNRIVREVMVPRIDVFALSADMTINEAAKILQEENYSRIPIYQGSLDNIVGVLLYKDLLNIYMGAAMNHTSHEIDQPVKSLAKNIFYTPETRKVSHLLQEFLQKQQHLALVVDEFGATEGIVTIEDILEEIVGDIADEYDFDEEELFAEHKDGWIVDGRMSLNDIEQHCHLKVPQLADYDTIGGYIIHRAGSIPEAGLKISHDNFDLEVISTSDRSIKKVRIMPRSKV